MSKVFITDYFTEFSLEKEVLGNNLSDKWHKDLEVVIVWHEYISKDYIDKLPKLKGIIRYGVGYDNVDLKYAKEKGVVVCNNPDYGTEEVADTTVAMIMNAARSISRYDYLCRNYTDGTWQENVLPGIKRNSHTTVGVIGAGRIGGSVVSRLNALRFKTLIFDPYKPSGYEKQLGCARVDSLKELLNVSDIVSINAPLSEETKGIVDIGFIGMMKKGASLVNTARGKLIKNIDVFYDALKSGHLTNVALDVIPEEPPKSSKLIDAWKNREQWLDGRLIINPHSAYFSDQAYFEIRNKAAKLALRIVNGEKPLNVVN